MNRHNITCFCALLANVVPLSVFAVLSAHNAHIEQPPLWIGVGALIVGAALAFLTHLKCKDAPLPLFASILIAGVSKGAFTATILYYTNTAQPWTQVELANQALLSCGIVLSLCLAFFALMKIPTVGRHPQWFFCPIMLALLIAAIVLLIVYHNAFFTLLLLHLLSLIFCFGARILEFDEAQELRFNTLVASYFYACFLLVVALVIICIVGDGDCDGDCCDCDCCDCGNGGKKKKEKK